MRKNGVNKELKEIEGGVCAPEGFKANGVYCGVVEGLGKNDFGLLYSDRRCPTACVYSTSEKQGAPVVISKKHLKNGYAQAIVFNSGKANVFHENGEALAKQICALIGKYAKIDTTDVLIASTGKIEKPLSITPFENKAKELVDGLGADDIHSREAAKSLMTNDRKLKQLSFLFELGDYPCKIGVIFKGSSCVCPNMATVLVFITTDVCISAEMLQRALSAEVKESFNLLNVDGVSSPNDMVCIMANGKAGNWKIDCVDSDYKKFAQALHEVAVRICKEIVLDNGTEKRLICNVSGTKSKQVSRVLAKSIIGVKSVKDSLLSGRLDVESLLYTIVGAGVEVGITELQILIRSDGGELVVREEGAFLPVSDLLLKRILAEREIELCLRFKDGNYSSTAFGTL